MRKAYLIKRLPHGIFKRQIFRFQRRVAVLQFLQAGVEDVQDGTLDGAHGRGHSDMHFHHFWLVLFQKGMHRNMESGVGERERERSKDVAGTSNATL